MYKTTIHKRMVCIGSAKWPSRFRYTRRQSRGRGALRHMVNMDLDDDAFNDDDAFIEVECGTCGKLVEIDDGRSKVIQSGHQLLEFF